MSDLKHPYDGVFELAERFDSVLDALGKPSSNVSFTMPARIASTPAEVQIKEVRRWAIQVREGGVAGQQVVYLRNPDYMPRDEMPSGSTGGRKVQSGGTLSTPGKRPRTLQRVR